MLSGMLLLVYPLSQWLGAAAGAGCVRVPRSVSLRKLMDEFPHPRRVAARAVRTWKAGLLYFCPRTFQPFSSVWVLLVEQSVLVFRDACATRFNSGYMFYGRLWAKFSFFYVLVNSNLETFCLHSRGAQSMLLVAVALSCCSLFDAGHYFKRSVRGSLRQFSLRRATFFGALDDEELFISEGSCQFHRMLP